MHAFHSRPHVPRQYQDYSHSFNPSTTDTLSHRPFVSHNMSPVALPNGNHASTSTLPPRVKATIPASEAMATLESYANGDGLSVSDLMDSKRNGGLTYNDFLILPGHISFPAGIVSLQTK